MIALLFAAVFAQAPERLAPEAVGAAANGKKVVIEGRVSSRLPTGDGQVVTVRGAPELRIAIGRGVPIPSEADFEGTLQAGGKFMVLVATKVTALPSEDRRYDDAAQAAGDNAEAWFQLERWAARRHALYGSEAMGERKIEAYSRGVAVLRAAAAGKPADLAALRARVLKEGKLPNFDVEEFDHAIARAEFAALPPGDPAALERFRLALEQRLPAAAKPQEPLPQRLAAEYAAAPVQTFRTRKDDRPRLARHWRCEALGQRLAALRQQGEPPYDLAMLARQLAPDVPGLARKWFADYAAASAPRLLDLHRASAAKLAELHELELGERGEAQRLRRDWLDGTERALKRREADGARAATEAGREFARDPAPWVELAQTRLAWFPTDADERQFALRQLVEVAAYAPDFAPLAEALPRLGYTRRPNGQWLPNAVADPLDPKRAARPERVALGMTVEDVSQLYGTPAQPIRIATAGGVLLHWRFASPGGEVRITFKGPPTRLQVVAVHAPGKNEATP